MARLCVRPACSQPAAATLFYDYEARTAWLEMLADNPHPAGYDLCAAHAERLSVPQGWSRSDRRAEPPARPTSLDFSTRVAV